MRHAATVTTISTLRHARTTFGEQERDAGSLDVPLSSQGVRDCRAASEALVGLRFDAVISSTLRRAVDIARLVAGDVPTQIRYDLCNERSFGVMEGLTWHEVRSLDPPILFIKVGNDFHSVNPTGGEPLEDLWERANRFVRLVFRQRRGTSVLVVSHGVFLQMCHGVLRGSNCIESLGTYPGNLQLRRLHFIGRRLVSEEVMELSKSRPPDF